jgi:hypothetical protein
MEARTVVMGDWGRVVRDPIDLLRATFFLGAAAFLVLGEIKGVGNLLVGGVWEIFEWGSDELFGSNLSMGNDDTVGDLIADTLGSIAGGLLLVAWTKYGWGSVRRVPGTNRAEDVDA